MSEATWNDWLESRIYFLTNWVKEPRREARKIAVAEMKLMRSAKPLGAVKSRSQIKNPLTGTWTKRDDKSGKFLDVKANPKPFKGVRNVRGR